jgi:hypothetical protein
MITLVKVTIELKVITGMKVQNMETEKSKLLLDCKD